MTTHHVCLSCSLTCSGVNGCRECRNLLRVHVTVPAMEVAGLTNAQAERFMAASEACLIALHEEMQKDTALAAIALDLDRVRRGLALLEQAERAAAAEEQARATQGRLMDPRSAMAYMDDVARRAEAAAAPPPSPSYASPEVPPAQDVAMSGALRSEEPPEAGPSTAEHAAALITRELLSNPALLQSVLATGIVAAQAAAMAAQGESDQAEPSEAEMQPEMDGESAAADEDVVNGEDAPASLPPPPTPPPAAAVRQEPAIARAPMRERPMDIADIMAAAESVTEDELLPHEPQELNGSTSLTLTDRASSPGDHTGVEENPPPLSS